MSTYFIRSLIILLIAGPGLESVRAQSTDQNYPVTASAFIMAQPNQKLASYFSSSRALTVSLLLKDLTKNSIQVYLRWSLDGPGVRVASMEGYIPQGLLLLDMGVLRRFSGLELQSDYFRNSVIEEQGLGGAGLRTNLPEGFYTFRVQAMEAGTGRQVSNIAETYFSITTPLPPVINLPFNGAEVMMTEPQRVSIQWMPRHYKQGSSTTTYDLKVCKVPDGYEPQEALDACLNPIIDDKANPGTFYPGNTGIGNSIIGAFERGARYAVRVTVHEFNNNDGQEVTFANEGRSEVTWFTYGTPCVSPESFTIRETGPGRLQLLWPAAAGSKSYRVLYRSEGESQWTTQAVTGTSTGLADLKPGKLEIAVQSECTDVIPANLQAYTIVVGTPEPSVGPLNPLQILVSTGPGVPPITIDGPYSVFDSLKIPCASQISTFDNCEVPLPKVIPTGTKQLITLNTGDVLSIYDMAVIVTSVSPGNGLSGKGLARLPFAQNVLTPVEFSGVKAYAAEAGIKGGCVYEVSTSGGYFRTRSVSGSALTGEKLAIIDAINGDATDSTGTKKKFTGSVDDVLKTIDSLTVIVSGGNGTADDQVLLDDLRKTLVDITDTWIDQVKQTYPNGNPHKAAADSLIAELEKLNDKILGEIGTAGGLAHVEDVYKDIIDDFNHPVPPGTPAAGTATALTNVTLTDMGACMNQVSSYNPLNPAGSNGLACLGNLNGSPYWTYEDGSGNSIYITGIKQPDGTIIYASASEADWRDCGRSPGEPCIGLWKPVTIPPGTADPNVPNPLVPSITSVIPNPVGSNTATINWEGHSSFVKYVVTYTGPGGGGLQTEILNTTGSNSGKLNLSNLLEASTYTFTIDAYGADGKILDSYKNGAFNTVTEKLATPQNLRTNIVNGSTVVLTWDKDQLHLGYDLVYTDAKGDKHTIPATTNSITISDLDSTVTYPFTLVAKGKGVNGKALVSDPANGVLKTRQVQPCEDDLVVSYTLADDLKSFSLGWVPIKGQTHTRVSYRQVISTQSTPQWKDLGETDKTNLTIGELSLNEQYEYKATPVCRIEGDPSNGKDDLTGHETGGMVFTTKQKIKPTVNYACGAIPPVKAKNPVPINNLQVGDLILIGDFPAEVLSLDKSSSPYKGKAATMVPYLGMSNFLMEFDALTVNADYEVLAGTMKAISDPVLRQQLSDKRNNKDASKENNASVKEQNYKEQIVNKVEVQKDANGKVTGVVVTKTDANGQITTETLPPGKNYQITDKEGNTVAVSEEGNLSPENGVPQPTVASADQSRTGDGTVVVKFKAAANQKFGFDGIDGGEGIWGRMNFKLGNGNTYYVPIKSIQAGTDDYVDFEKSGGETVTFKWEVNGVTTPIMPENNRFKLNIPYADQQGTLIALDDQNRMVGKLQVLSFAMVTKKVVLVTLDGNAQLDAAGLQTEINKIFGPGVANVQVSSASNFASKLYDAQVGVDVATDHYTYSLDMIGIIDEFRASGSYVPDENTVYLFIGKTSSGTISGVMNRASQFGFIFKNDSKIIAHELGHGIFRLEHIGQDGSDGKAIEDLMDYTPMGINLYKYQWMTMHNPPAVWEKVENSTDARWETDGHYSTVFMLGLQLGLGEELSQKLAQAAEAPDTDVHAEKEYVMNDTWAFEKYQERIHALSGGYFSEEEFKTTIALLNTPLLNIKLFGELLHRYGDCYAHTRLADLNTPIDEKRMYGLVKVERPFLGRITEEHMGVDGATPDYISARPEWYKKYIRNLGDILYMKLKDEPGINFQLFYPSYSELDRLADYAADHKVALIGIMDFEIARVLHKKSFLLPYFKSGGGKAPLNFVTWFAEGNAILSDSWYNNVLSTEAYLKFMNIKYKKSPSVKRTRVIPEAWEFNGYIYEFE